MLFILSLILISSIFLNTSVYSTENSHQPPTHSLTLTYKTPQPPIQKTNIPSLPTSYSSNSIKTAEQQYFKDSQYLQSISWEEIQAICYNKTPEQLFNDFSYYANPYYFYVINQQQGYEDFILNLHQKYTDDHDYRKTLRCIKGFYPYEFLKLIDSEYDRIKALRQERKHLKQIEFQKRLENAKDHCLHINNTNEYQIFFKYCELEIKNAQVLDNQSLINRFQKRIAAAQKSSVNSMLYDYSSQLKAYPVWNDPDAVVFNNRIGTALDQQLHEELCDIRSRMHELTLKYSNNDYSQFYAPIIYQCTAMAKQERNAIKAFSLSDFSDAVVTILSKGMHILIQTVAGSCKGLLIGAKTVMTPQHWVDLAASIPAVVLQSIVVLSNEHGRLERLEQAIMIGDSDLYFKRCNEYEKLSAIRMKALGQNLAQVASMSWHDLGMHGTYFGTTFVLDCVGLYAFKLVASSTGRELANKIAHALQSPKASQTMVEVAGIGKIAAEDGVDAACKVTEVIQENPIIFEYPKQPIVKIAQELGIIESSGLRSIGENLWKSPGGVIYGRDEKFGNALNHMFAHMHQNPLKKRHTIFSIQKEKMVTLIDEAWALKGTPLMSDPVTYIVDMKRIIGTDGETAIRLVVKKPGTAELLTAYPVKMKE